MWTSISDPSLSGCKKKEEIYVSQQQYSITEVSILKCIAHKYKGKRGGEDNLTNVLSV